MNLAVLLFFLISSLSFSSSTATAAELFFYTENYAPYSYIDEKTGEPDGLSVEITREILNRVGADYEIKLVPWKRGFEATLLQGNSCLFTTGRTPERENKFHWVTPFATSDLVLFSMGYQALEVKSLRDAAKYRIGGYLADAAAKFLQQRNIEVETVTENKYNLAKLQNGRIDLWATGEINGLTIARQMKVSNLKKSFVMDSMPSGIACNPTMNDDFILRMQKELDNLYRSGIVSKLYNKYLPGIPIPSYFPHEDTNRP